MSGLRPPRPPENGAGNGLVKRLDSFGHNCACVMRGTMEVERRLQEILSIDPLSPIDIPSGELSENPAFFIPLHINYIKQDAEALNLHSRHFHRAPITSGLHRKADIFGVCRHVSKVPLSDIRPVQGRVSHDQTEMRSTVPTRKSNGTVKH